MPWEPIDPLIFAPGGSYSRVELPPEAGKLHVLIPGFDALITGYYEAGLFSGSREERQIVGIKRFAFSVLDRYIEFDFPPDLPTPFLGLRNLGSLSGSVSVQPFVNISSCERLMAFYNDELDVFRLDVDQQLSQRIIQVDAIPDPREWDEGEQVLFQGTGETITRRGNRWVGEPQQESSAVMVQPKADLVQGESLDAARALAYDFNGGPTTYIESLALSNSTDRSQTFDFVVPGHDRDEALFGQLERNQALTLQINKVSSDGGFRNPDIHALVLGNQAVRASFVITYRNIYTFVPPVVIEEAPAEEG